MVGDVTYVPHEVEVGSYVLQRELVLEEAVCVCARVCVSLSVFSGAGRIVSWLCSIFVIREEAV